MPNRFADLMRWATTYTADLGHRGTDYLATVPELLLANVDQFLDFDSKKILHGVGKNVGPLLFDRRSVHKIPLYTRGGKLLGWTVPTTVSMAPDARQWVDSIREMRRWADAKEVRLHHYGKTEIDLSSESYKHRTSSNPSEGHQHIDWFDPILIGMEIEPKGKYGIMSVGGRELLNVRREAVQAVGSQYARLFLPKLKEIAKAREARSEPLHVALTGSYTADTEFASMFTDELNRGLKEAGRQPARVFVSPNEVVFSTDNSGTSYLTVSRLRGIPLRGDPPSLEFRDVNPVDG